MREHYRRNPAFKELMDGLRPDHLREFFRAASALAYDRTGERWDIDRFAALFDEDFCVYLQNVCQPPVRLHQECSPEVVEGLYEREGLTEVRRLQRYVRRSNVRKYLAPLHYESAGDSAHPLTRLLYGEGSVEYIARKP